MNFLSMEYFVSVIKNQSITKAASVLHITEQTLSAHMLSLEKELEVKLFERKKPIELTYAGEMFYKYAKNFHSEYIRMENDFAELHENKRGILKIGIGHTRGRTVMPDIIMKFNKKYPIMEIEFFENTNDMSITDLKNGDIDIIIGRIGTTDPEIEQVHFYDEEVVCVIPKCFTENRDINSIKTFADVPFLFGKADDISGYIGREYIKKAGFIPHTVFQAVNIATIVELSAMGMGICFSPKNLLTSTLSKEKLAGLIILQIGNEAKYPINIGYLKNSPNRINIDKFINICKNKEG